MSEHKDKAKLGINVVSDPTLSPLGGFKFGAEAEWVKSFWYLERLCVWGSGVCSVKSGVTTAEHLCRLCGLGLMQVDLNEVKEAHALPKCMHYALTFSAVRIGCTAIFVQSKNPFRCALRACHI